MSLLGFDIEISNIFDLQPGEDLEKYAPFDVSVAATLVDGGERRLWVSRGANDDPALNLSPERAGDLLEYLDQMQRDGHAICAWNGLSFDLRWIGHVAGDIPLASQIALKMFDPMFQFFMAKGFPVGLAAVGQGMGIPTVKSLDAADAPRLWRQGNYKEVCEYVLGDVRMTVEIVSAIQARREIAWMTRRGTLSTVPISRLRTVEDCLGDEMPDQSWMDSPMPAGKFTSWLAT